jgi:hypothetical protein
MRRVSVVFALLLILASSCLAQTKPPAKTQIKPAKKHSTANPAAAMMVPLGEEKWGDVPPAAMKGTPSVELGGRLQLAVLQGNPMLPSQPYTLRLSCADGVKIAPHWHPATENVTVIKGTLAIGMGSNWDQAALHELPTGGFASAAARMKHFAACKGDTVLQVHGLGPFVVNFVRPDKSAAGN